MEEEKEEEELKDEKDERAYFKKQWLYKTILIIAIIGSIIAVLASGITYYVVTKEKTNKFIISVNKAKGNEEGKEETSKIVKAQEATGAISELLNVFAQFIDTNYIGEIDKNELVDSTLKGFIEGIGDEYSEYMTAEEWEEYQADSLGNYVGVGIYMRIDEETKFISVDSTIKDTPAEKAGIKSGDLIVAVDGESVYGLSLNEVSSKVKGEEGTEVVLTVNRASEVKEFKVDRGPRGFAGRSFFNVNVQRGGFLGKIIQIKIIL